LQFTREKMPNGDPFCPANGTSLWSCEQYPLTYDITDPQTKKATMAVAITIIIMIWSMYRKDPLWPCLCYFTGVAGCSCFIPYIFPHLMEAANPNVVGSFTNDPGAILRYYNWLLSPVGKASQPEEEEKTFNIIIASTTLVCCIIARYFAQYRNPIPQWHNTAAKYFFWLALAACTLLHGHWCLHLTQGGFRTLWHDLTADTVTVKTTGKVGSACGMWTSDALGLYVAALAWMVAETRFDALWTLLMGPSFAGVYAFWHAACLDNTASPGQLRPGFSTKRLVVYLVGIATALRLWLPEIMDWIDTHRTGNERMSAGLVNPSVAYASYSVGLGWAFMTPMTCYAFLRAFPGQYDGTRYSWIGGFLAQYWISFGANIMFFQQVAVAAMVWMLICSCADPYQIHKNFGSGKKKDAKAKKND